MTTITECMTHSPPGLVSYLQYNMIQYNTTKEPRVLFKRISIVDKLN